jgi:hypothetical protein
MNYEIDDEGLRLLANLEQHYHAWLEARRSLLPGRLTWKTVSGSDYLYCIVNGRGDGRSLGPRSAETERRYDAAQSAKQTAKGLWATLLKEGALYRTMRLPRISPDAARLLRELDLYGLLGDSVMLVGTNALAAYEIEAGASFASAAGVDSTQDFDVTWVATDARQTTLSSVGSAPRTLLDVLKRVDATYTVNTERTFQARNSSGYEVEILLPQSLKDTLPRNETLAPIPFLEQDWLLPGRRVQHVVCGLDGQPARIVAPDPRMFALQKLWLADKPTRAVLKRPKDVKQGRLLLGAIKAQMPHYPLDEEFRDSLPSQLLPYFDREAILRTPS